MATLRGVLLMTRDVGAAVEFYSRGLGLGVVSHQPGNWAELSGGPINVMIRQVDSEALRATAYSPFLNFTVNDFDTTLYRLLGMGATLDGPVKHPHHGKVAALRAPDGHMIGLQESQ